MLRLRDIALLDGAHEVRIVGISSRDYNVAMADGRIRANVEPDRLRPAAPLPIALAGRRRG